MKRKSLSSPLVLWNNCKSLHTLGINWHHINLLLSQFPMLSQFIQPPVSTPLSCHCIKFNQTVRQCSCDWLDIADGDIHSYLGFVCRTSHTPTKPESTSKSTPSAARNFSHFRRGWIIETSPSLSFSRKPASWPIARPDLFGHAMSG